MIFEKSLVLIPVFNEEEQIINIINECKKYFKHILCVDDGSSDSTYKLIDELKDITLLSHCINCGQGTALLTGIKYFLKYTNLEYLITLDGDGQHSIKDICLMLDVIENNNYDAVLGSRFLNKEYLSKVPFKRKFLLQVARVFEKLFYRINLTDAHNGLRVLKRNACIELKNLECSEMAHATEIAYKLTRSNLKIIEYPCKIKYENNLKGSQLSLNGLNIISELIQRK